MRTLNALQPAHDLLILSSLSFSRYQQQAQFIQLGGHHIAYWQSPDAGLAHRPTILFIHGFPGASWDWHYQWKYLARDYPLICADMLGFGLSDKPRAYRYSLLEQADIYEALLREKDIYEFHIIAHDYGVSVAQELLYRQTQRQAGQKLPEFQLQSVCFLNGGLFTASHRPLRIQKWLKGWLGPWLVRGFSKKDLNKSLSKIFGRHTQPENQDVDILWQLLQHNQGHLAVPDILRYIDERKEWGERWTEAMITTSLPLYLINGIQDPIAGRQMLDHYIDVIPNARTTHLDVGHYPHWEAPTEVLGFYQHFLTSVV